MGAVTLRRSSFVGGGFVGGGGETLPVFNPWTGEEIADIDSATPDQVDEAISKARHAFDTSPWPHLPPAERGVILRRIAEGLTSQRAEVAKAETLNGGKPYEAALQEVDGAARVFTYYSGAADKFFGETIPQGSKLLNFTLREPLGVVAQIVPWNFPILGASWKLAPALAAGCCSLLKPSPATPLSALILAEIMQEAGVPPGVANVLTGGADVGRTLCTDEAVDGVSFTGSTAVGAEIIRLSANTIKRLMLELGGKNASIIFADADLKRAAEKAAASAFGNSGQSCSARSRVLVERSIMPAFVEALKDAAQKLRPGDPFEPATTFGPLISEAHRRSVSELVDAAISEGAVRAAGGQPIAGRGFFYEPTILCDVAPHNVAFKAEIFGPVCSVTPFDSEEDAVRLANDSDHGLNGSVWSSDLGRALRTARAVRTGMISINGLASASRNSLYAPFGGYKRSGIGRELGMNALHFYTEIKTVTIDHS